jgi:hypothetical protein
MGGQARHFDGFSIIAAVQKKYASQRTNPPNAASILKTKSPHVARGPGVPIIIKE